MLKKLAVILSVAFSLLLFVSLIGYVIWFNLTNVRYLKLSTSSEKALPEGTLIPSEILANQVKYQQQKVSVRGKVETEMVVCERKECPAGDACCGCPPTRNLRIDDPEASLISGGQKILRILDTQGQSFCQRLTNSCDYDCPDWFLGGVYEARGTFLTDTFRVENKVLVRRPNLADSLGNFFLGIKKKISSLKTSGSFVLP